MSAEKKLCAYCGRRGPLSREHVIPAFRYRQSPGSAFGFSRRAGKWIHQELVVKDVCQACNNGPLSELDNYAKSLIEENKLDRHVRKGRDIPISYDYNLLLRFLLKTSFNSQRAFDGADPIFAKIAPFILGNDKACEHANFRIYLEIRRCPDLDVTNPVFNRIPNEVRELGYLPPKSALTGRLLSSTAVANKLPLPCYVSFGNFRFYIFILPKEIDRDARRHFVSVSNSALPGLVELKSGKTRTTVKISDLPLLSWYESDRQHGDEWKKQFPTDPID